MSIDTSARGYEFGADLYVTGVLLDELAGALERAGITPEEFNRKHNAPDEPEPGSVRPKAHFLFRKNEDGSVQAWREGEPAPEPPEAVRVRKMLAQIVDGRIEVLNETVEPEVGAWYRIEMYLCRNAEGGWWIDRESVTKESR